MYTSTQYSVPSTVQTESVTIIILVIGVLDNHINAAFSVSISIVILKLFGMHHFAQTDRILIFGLTVQIHQCTSLHCQPQPES